MSAPASSSASPQHPSPHRHAVRPGRLWFGLLAAPLAWLGEELLSYAIASHICAATGPDAQVTRAGSPWLWLVLLVALGVSLAGGWVALDNWRDTRGEKSGSGHHLLELGEGRTRFMAMCSLLTSGGFLFGFIFMLATLALAPLCAR